MKSFGSVGTEGLLGERLVREYAMSLLASGNVSTAWILNYINRATTDVERIQKRLLTGERELDSVKIGVADRLSSEATTSTQALSNVNEGISYLNVADTAISSVQDIMYQVSDLINQSSQTFDPTQQDLLNTEANELIQQANDLINYASYNGKYVFDGSMNDLNFYPGSLRAGSFKVTVGDKTAITYGTIDISSTGDPTTELANLESFLDTLESRRGVIAAGMSRASAAAAYLGAMAGVYDEAAVTMRSIDTTEEITALDEALALQETVTQLLTEQLASKEALVTQLYEYIRDLNFS